MSIVAHKWTRMAMAGVVAVGMTREAAFAQDDIAAFGDALAATQADTTLLDDLENNVLAYARSLERKFEPHDASAEKFNSLMQHNSMSALQKTLNEFRSVELEPNHLPQVEVTGTLNFNTAVALMKVVPEAQFYDLLVPPPLGKYDHETLMGLTRFRMALKNLAPQPYIEALEQIATRFDEERSGYATLYEGSLASSFVECALNIQEDVLTPEAHRKEIDQVTAEPNYVSRLVPEGCYIYLNQISTEARKTAQLDFLHGAQVLDDKRAVWCHRQGAAGDFAPCLEQKL